MAINLTFKERINFFLFKISGSTRGEFYEGVSSLISSGLSLGEAFRKWEEKLRQSGANLAYLDVLSYIQDAMSNGMQFSEAIRDIIPSDEAIVIFAGESGGTLEQSLMEAKRLVETKNEMRSSIVKATLMPAIGMLMGWGITGGVKFYMFPEFAKVANMEPEKLVAYASNPAVHWLWQLFPLLTGIFIAVIGIAIFTAVAKDNLVGPIRDFMDKWYPPFILYRWINGGMMLLGLSSLLSSNALGFRKAISMLRDNASPYMKEKYDIMLDEIYEHGDLSRAVNVGLLPKKMEVMVGVFEGDKDFASVRLPTLSQTVIKYTMNRIGTLSETAKTAIMVVVAIIIIVTVFGMFGSVMTIRDLMSSGSI